MFIKKRLLYVAETDYSKVTNLLQKAAIQFWNESGAFHFDLMTAIITAAGFGLVALGIHFLP